MSDEKERYFYRIEDLPVVMLTEKSKSHMVAGRNTLVSFIENPPGCIFPTHSHPAEQILIILEGEENHICGGEKFIMKAGDICIHPPNMPHGGETKTGFKGIDIFCPPREDWMEKLKQALKEGENG
ncbi:MAG: cupin domain-containing protein [Deltaproteobacteria bacterium]|nr:cupin domain-containing protein [Deltaproteobacteria bacterium]